MQAGGPECRGRSANNRTSSEASVVSELALGALRNQSDAFGAHGWSLGTFRSFVAEEATPSVQGRIDGVLGRASGQEAG